LDRKKVKKYLEDAIETEIYQLIDHQTFKVFDPGEAIASAYQKIPYQIVSDVKYDLSHIVRLVAGGN
jgi:hypothetical protein